MSNNKSANIFLKDAPLYGIGQRIEARRIELGLSVYELASLSGITQKTLYSIRKGDSVPSNETLIKISRALDCEVGYLNGDYQTPHREDTIVREKIGISKKAWDILVNNRELEVENAGSPLPSNNDFISFFIESSKGIAESIRSEVDLLQMGYLWEYDDSFKLIKKSFMKALKNNPYIPSVDILEGGNHEERVIDEAIDSIIKFDPEVFITGVDENGEYYGLGIVNPDKTYHIGLVKKMLKYLYEKEVRTQGRRFYINQQIMTIIDSFIKKYDAE